jgi:hypothetical protein
LAFQACIYHALIRLTPYFLVFSYHYAPLLFNCLQYTYVILYSYVDGMFQYFSFYSTYFPLPSPTLPSDRLIIAILFFLSHTMCVCVYLTYGLASTYERKHLIFKFLSLAYFINSMFSSSIHLPESIIISFFFMAE